MNHLAIVNEDALLENLEAEEAVETGQKWELKQLKPMHKQVASLLAQGKKQVDIAAMVGITPEYVSMLLAQPLVKAYVNQMCDIIGVRMEALFEQSVEVVADVMKNGNNSDKLKAARLQMEATKRIGRPDPMAAGHGSNEELLEKLANRLMALQSNIRKGGIFKEDGTPVSAADIQ